MQGKGAMLPIILSERLKNIKSSILLNYFIYLPPLGGLGGDRNARSATALLPRSGRAASSGVGAQRGRAPQGAGAARTGVPRSAGAGRERSERLRPRPGGGRSAPAAWGWTQCAPCPLLVGVGGRVGTSAQRYLSPPIGGPKGCSRADGGSIFAVNCKNTAVIPIGGRTLRVQIIDF